MRVAELEALPSFALLGPGFGDGACRLLTGLAPATAGPRIVFAPFEVRGRAVCSLGGRLERVDALELPPAAEVVEMLATGEGIDVVNEDPEFYKWLASQGLPANGAG